MTERLFVEGVVELRVGTAHSPRGRGRRMYCCSTAGEPRVLVFHRAPRAWRRGVPPGVDARACVGRVQHTLDLRAVQRVDVVECVDAGWAVGEAAGARAELVLREAGGRVWALTVDGRDAVRMWRRALARLLAAPQQPPAAPPPVSTPSECVRCRSTSVVVPTAAAAVAAVAPPQPQPPVVPVAPAATTATTTTVTGTRPRAQTLDVQRIMAVLDTLMPKADPPPCCTPCDSASSGALAAACDTDDCGAGGTGSSADTLSQLDVHDDGLAPPTAPATTAVVHADAHTPCAAAVQRIVHSPMMAVLPPLFPLPSLPPIMSAPADSACFSPTASAPASPVVVLPSL